MRLERIVIENFRQYRKAEFPILSGLSDINIVIGSNGTGKTNLLNAINWCLYGDEPHTSKNPKKLPIVNIEALNDANSDTISIDTKVITYFVTRDKTKIIIERKLKNYIQFENEKPVPLPKSPILLVKKISPNDDDLIFKGDEAKSFVEKLLPKRIREFFFFDGEKLDKYFSISAGNKIYNSIYRLAQVDLIEKTITNTRNVKRDLEREASKYNPQAKKFQKDKEELEENLDDLISRIEIARRNKDIAKEKIDEYTQLLNDVPDVLILNEEANKIKEEVIGIELSLQEKKEAKKEFLLATYQEISLFNSIKFALNLIREKKDKGEIPATIDVSLIDSIIDKHKCICGSDIKENKQALEALRKLRNSVNISSISATKLSSINPVLDEVIIRLKKYGEKIKPLTRDISHFETESIKYEKRLDEINREIAGHDEERISNWHHEKTQFEKQFENLTSDISFWERDKEEFSQNLKELDTKISEELLKEEKSIKLRKHVNFIAKALKVLERSKNKILDDLRKEMENETKKIFFELHWKEKTFKDVRIDDEYSIHLIHKDDYDCLGSSSAGEGQILALAFIIALHNISRFDAPIFIDTPVGRISDILRKNIAEIFANLSKSKQLLILFTPSEYSSDMSEIIEPIRANKFELDPSKSETEIEVSIL